ncbi:zinc dependent phospholipase C family protein [Photobacterium atrarenae]|uniref:Zinc dependent phospholipase C family protein n=1 Tax=Photobacterium atrarenae TaxID=865757 RepID=A0ABY5GCA6_9GAMM|nr:zinc dependent phospholipase C family protein [Photobacterium atrarenae]UTV26440.1 zinc dependent phospholipase C family protein [Photobacterium atrarenae]
MPGAYAHISAAYLAAEKAHQSVFQSVPKQARNILTNQQKFIELGSVSPDFPYLKIGDLAQNRWADRMHYEQVGVFIRRCIAEVANLSGPSQEKAFAWLCGYVAHVATDITIHPVIERRVGPYETNQTEHRICEMHQDVHICRRFGLSEEHRIERLANYIGTCTHAEDNRHLDPVISNLWEQCLMATFGREPEIEPPLIHDWYTGYLAVLKGIEEGHKLLPFARHVGAQLGLVYPEQVDDSYIRELDTPLGVQHYDQVFDRAVAQIIRYWEVTAKAVFEAEAAGAFLNWNLDTGRCEKGQLTAWKET